MSDENFDIVELFREMIYKKLGIHLSPDRKYILELKLNKMLLKDKTKDLKSFYEAIKNGDREAFETLTHFITTNHTFFFRESEHFQILVNLIKKSGKKSPIIWSAATSTGEEVYSIIISLLEANINDFTIIASDIDKNVLLKMKEGIYRQDCLKGVEPSLKLKYFNKIQGGSYRVSEKLKKNIFIKKINLIDDFILEKKADYIFCRNVMIYFDIETRKKVIDTLLDNLSQDGYLFIGHSENLFNITDKVEIAFVSVYKKR